MVPQLSQLANSQHYTPSIVATVELALPSTAIPLQQPMFGDGEASLPIIATAVKPAAAPKSLYVLKADVEKYGYTDECPACTDLHLGGKVRPDFPHSSECRERIFEKLQKDHNTGNDKGSVYFERYLRMGAV